MRAVILAGGKGRRLEPYTITFPKPMVPVGDMPILEIVVRQLQHAGFDHVTMAVGHLAGLLMAYFGDGQKWGLKIDYSYETDPLGTVGPLALIETLPESFLVMNGDVLTTLRYDDLVAQHIASGASLTIASHRCITRVDLGVIEFDGQHRVTGYREKPTLPYDVSMGVYVFNRSVLELFEAGSRVDFPEVVDTLIQREGLIKVYQSDAEWLDIGRAEDYALASERFIELRDQFLPSRKRARSVA